MNITFFCSVSQAFKLWIIPDALLFPYPYIKSESYQVYILKAFLICPFLTALNALHEALLNLLSVHHSSSLMGLPANHFSTLMSESTSRYINLATSFACLGFYDFLLFFWINSTAPSVAALRSPSSLFSHLPSSYSLFKAWLSALKSLVSFWPPFLLTWFPFCWNVTPLFIFSQTRLVLQ